MTRVVEWFAVHEERAAMERDDSNVPIEEFLRDVPDDEIEIELRDAGEDRAGEDAAG